MKKSSKPKSTRLNAKKGRALKKGSKSTTRKSTAAQSGTTSGTRKGRAKKTGRGPKAGASAAPAAGTRKGTKRSDLRFIAPDGSEWASPFEFRVYSSLEAMGHVVRRTTAADALSYTTPVKNGAVVCFGEDLPLGTNCQVVQRRVYTPDLVLEYAHSDWIADPILDARTQDYKFLYLETKGYFSPQKRNLFRAARQSNPQVDIRLVVSSNHWVTKGKTRLTDWAKRFKIPIHVWDGKLPEDWL